MQEEVKEFNEALDAVSNRIKIDVLTFMALYENAALAGDEDNDKGLSTGEINELLLRRYAENSDDSDGPDRSRNYSDVTSITYTPAREMICSIINGPLLNSGVLAVSPTGDRLKITGRGLITVAMDMVRKCALHDNKILEEIHNKVTAADFKQSGRTTEADLVVPALMHLATSELQGASGLSTADLRDRIMKTVPSSKEDSEILKNRKDTKLSQSIRNLVSHNTLAKDGLATRSKVTNELSITRKGYMKLLPHLLQHASLSGSYSVPGVDNKSGNTATHKANHGASQDTERDANAWGDRDKQQAGPLDTDKSDTSNTSNTSNNDGNSGSVSYLPTRDESPVGAALREWAQNDAKLKADNDHSEGLAPRLRSARKGPR